MPCSTTNAVKRCTTMKIQYMNVCQQHNIQITFSNCYYTIILYYTLHFVAAQYYLLLYEQCWFISHRQSRPRHLIGPRKILGPRAQVNFLKINTRLHVLGRYISALKVALSVYSEIISVWTSIMTLRLFSLRFKIEIKLMSSMV